VKIKTRCENDNVTIEISGRIDVYTASAVGEAIQSAIADGALRVRLDLTSVSVIDSSGLGTLVGNAQIINTRGGFISLIGVRPRLKRVLEITGLCRYFNIDGCTPEEAHEMQLSGVGETPGS
jgi:anti-sigma B factor antagonist